MEGEGACEEDPHQGVEGEVEGEEGLKREGFCQLRVYGMENEDGVTSQRLTREG